MKDGERRWAPEVETGCTGYGIVIVCEQMDQAGY